MSDESISYLYDIYDSVYNYNFLYSFKLNQGHVINKDIYPEYKALKNLFFASLSEKYPPRYNMLLESLKKAI